MLEPEVPNTPSKKAEKLSLTAPSRYTRISGFMEDRINSGETLKQSMAGQPIKQAQELLNQAFREVKEFQQITKDHPKLFNNSSELDEDALFGPKMKKALELVQSKLGLDPKKHAHGQFDQETLLALKESLSPSRDNRVLASRSMDQNRQLVRGIQFELNNFIGLESSKFLREKLVQANLISKNGEIDVDGFYGPITEKVVQTIQAHIGETATGVVTPKFLEQLKDRSKIPPAPSYTPETIVHYHNLQNKLGQQLSEFPALGLRDQMTTLTVADRNNGREFAVDLKSEGYHIAHRNDGRIVIFNTEKFDQNTLKITGLAVIEEGKQDGHCYAEKMGELRLSTDGNDPTISLDILANQLHPGSQIFFVDGPPSSRLVELDDREDQKSGENPVLIKESGGALEIFTSLDIGQDSTLAGADEKL